MDPKHAYKKRTDGVPATNRETGRTVYVLPETIKKHPDKFEALPEEKAGDPRWRGKPKPPRPPDGPDKPRVPRESPPAPIRPQLKAKPSKRMEPANKVKPVKPMKDPKPSPKRRWKQPKKFKTANAASVLRRYLEALDGEA